MKKIKIWVLVIQHDHGTNVHAHHSEEGAQKELLSFVKEYWDDVTEQPMPTDEEELVEQYFTETFGAETYELEEVEVEP